MNTRAHASACTHTSGQYRRGIRTHTHTHARARAYNHTREQALPADQIFALVTMVLDLAPEAASRTSSGRVASADGYGDREGRDAHISRGVCAGGARLRGNIAEFDENDKPRLMMPVPVSARMAPGGSVKIRCDNDLEDAYLRFYYQFIDFFAQLSLDVIGFVTILVVRVLPGVLLFILLKLLEEAVVRKLLLREHRILSFIFGETEIQLLYF